MAFTGTHVMYGAIKNVGNGVSLFCEAIWSESMVSPDTSALAASEKFLDQAEDGLMSGAFLIQPSVDIWVSVAPAPNAAVSPRYLVRAGEAVTIPCNYGDKLAWAAV